MPEDADFATAVCQEIDGDSDQMKAFRAWMLRVNQYLKRAEAVDVEEFDELRSLAFQATGWGDVVEGDD